MSEFNPYGVIGINRAADAKTIKKAYRKKAASADPEQGLIGDLHDLQRLVYRTAGV